jgi:hypothetical protein
MKTLKSCLAFALLASAFLYSACSASLATQASPSAAAHGQAAYGRLELSSDSAWQRAVAAGKVVEGSVLVKTSAGFDAAVLAALGASETGSLELPGGTWRRLSVAAGSERSVISALRGTTGVRAAEPENLLHMPKGESGSSAISGSSVNIKGLGTEGLNDPYVGSAEYGLAIAHAIEAYAAYPLSGKVAYAAALDTGINLAHDEFIDSTSGTGASIVVRAMSAFTRNSDGSYTFVGNEKSFTTVTSGANWDDDGHGSHVAGIMGALGNNGQGTAGVMWKGLKLISYKVFADDERGSSGSGTDWAVYGALLDLADWWAVASNHGDTTQVTLPVNMSLGGSYAGSFEMEAIAYALEKKLLVVAAMGNEGSATVEYPAGYSGVLAVGATTGADALADFSSTGKWMSVCAPGSDIVSTFNGDSDYAWESGTSMAAPFVTGLAAYVLAYVPLLEPDQVKAVLEQSADKIGGATGYTTDFGNGRVDAKAALELATDPAKLPESGSSYSLAALVVSVTANGSALADQEVYLYDDSGDFIEVGITDSEGQASFVLLKPDTYTLKASRNGVEKTAEATLAGGSGEADVAVTIVF